MSLSGSVWRSTWLHCGLLIVALAGAWLTYRRPFDDDPSAAARGLEAFQAAAGDVERVIHERPGRTLAIEARRDDLGRWFSGREEPDAVFVGGRRVAEIWEDLEPLRVVRILDDVDADKLEELELAGDAAPDEFLAVTVRGREISYRLGGRPFGGSDRYARRLPGGDGGDSGPDDRVVVLPSEIIGGLGGGAEMLMERRLLAASRPEVEVMTLSKPGTPNVEPLRVVQRTGANPLDAYWTVGEADEADADIAAWVDKFFRLSAVAYRNGEPEADWRAEASITVESREHGASTLEIWSSPVGDRQVWLARSPFSRLVVELSASLAEEVCADLDGLLR